MPEFVCERLENMVREGGNAGNQHILFFDNVSKSFLQRSLKFLIMWQGLTCDVYNIVRSTRNFRQTTCLSKTLLLS